MQMQHHCAYRKTKLTYNKKHILYLLHIHASQSTKVSRGAPKTNRSLVGRADLLAHTTKSMSKYLHSGHINGGRAFEMGATFATKLGRPGFHYNVWGWWIGFFGCWCFVCWCYMCNYMVVYGSCFSFWWCRAHGSYGWPIFVVIVLIVGCLLPAGIT